MALLWIHVNDSRRAGCVADSKKPVGNGMLVQGPGTCDGKGASAHFLAEGEERYRQAVCFGS